MASKITKIGITNDKISGRGGISFYLKYIDNIGLYNLVFTYTQVINATFIKVIFCVNIALCEKLF